MAKRKPHGRSQQQRKPRRSPPPPGPSVRAELRRASSRIGLTIIGAVEVAIGVAIFVGSGSLVARLIRWAGHDLSVWDRRVVFFLQFAIALGFLVQGCITVYAGVVLTIRSYRDQLRGGDS